MRRIVLVLLVVLALAAGGCSASDDQTAGTGAAATTGIATDDTATTVDTTATPVPARDAFSAIPDVLDEVEPSVVTVFVSGSQGSGSGSGVIWDDQGRIVTNNHVVEGAEKVEVQLATGVQLPARVIGRTSAPTSPSSRSTGRDCPRPISPRRCRARGSWRSPSAARSGSRTL